MDATQFENLMEKLQSILEAIENLSYGLTREEETLDAILERVKRHE